MHVACWGSERGGLPDKLRFKRAENEGEGEQRPTFVKRRGEVVLNGLIRLCVFVMLGCKRFQRL